MNSATEAYAACQRYEEFTVSADRGELTPASVWHFLTGSTIGDELLDWPADVFALTEVIIKRSEVHRFALSPPECWVWPPSRISDWPEAVEEAGRQWGRWSKIAKQRSVSLWPKNGGLFVSALACHSAI